MRLEPIPKSRQPLEKVRFDILKADLNQHSAKMDEIIQAVRGEFGLEYQGELQSQDEDKISMRFIRN